MKSLGAVTAQTHLSLKAPDWNPMVPATALAGEVGGIWMHMAEHVIKSEEKNCKILQTCLRHSYVCFIYVGVLTIWCFL